jgi:hypothetical protein
MNATTPATPETTAPAFAPIDLDIGDGQVGNDESVARAGLLLDPEGRAVILWWGVRASVPADVSDRRLLLANVNPKAEGESVRTIVGANLRAIAAIFDLYRGHEREGSNDVGRWAGEAGELEGLVEDLERELAKAEIYRDAGDWLAPVWSEVTIAVRAALLSGRDLNDLAAEWARDGANAGTLVHASDVREAFDRAAGRLREGREDVYVVWLGAEPKASPLDEAGELPEAKAFGETWRVVEADSEVDAMIKARELDGASAEVELVKVLATWDEDYVAPLAAHLGRPLPA